MTKKIIFFAAGFLLSIFITGEIFSQTWITSTINSTAVSSLKFPGPNTGYAYYNKKVYKSTSKGKTWSEIHDFGSESIDVLASMVAPSDNLIMLHGGLKIFRSTDGGSNWSNSSIIVDGSAVTSTSEFPIIKFKDQNVGFLTYTKKFTGNKTYILKTTDGGSSWSQVASFETTSDIATIITDLGFSITNPNDIVAVGYFWNRNNNQKVYLTSTSTNNGDSWSSVTGGGFSANVYQHYEAINYFNNSNNDLGIIKTITDNVTPGNSRAEYIRYINGTPNTIVISYGDYARKTGGLVFTDNNIGYCRITDEVYRTTNGGVNWTQELDGSVSTLEGFNNFLSAFGDIAYTPFTGTLYTRSLSTNLVTYFDGVSGNGSLAFDGDNYGTPSTQNLRGGLSEVYANPILPNTSISNTESIFYKWYSGYMNHVQNPNYLSPSSFIAQYKTKKYSNSGTAINNSAQRRAFRDRFGKVNTIHESLGGIFFTKSTDNGNTFITEQVVNDNPDDYNSYATDNNINSFISEVHRPAAIQGGGNDVQSPEKTPIVSWERREGNTIKIKVANRRKHYVGTTYYYWKTDDNISFDISNVTDPNYKAFPKVFSTLRGFIYEPDPSPYDTVYKHFYSVAYLKPDVSGSKLMLKCRDEGAPSVLVADFEVASGNISDLSVEAGYPYSSSNPAYVELHMTYKKDNKIYYRKEIVEYAPVGGSGVLYHTTDPSPFEVSSTDGLASRWTPDISLRNGLPIVVYRGARTVQHVINWDGAGGGLPDVLEINKSPIYVRKKNSQGGWDNFQSYESPGTSTQENPDIEASVDANAHLVGFSRNNSTFYKFVQIDGLSGYQCDPPTFSGNDAKFVKGSYTGQTGGTSYPMLWTSKSENSLYKIDKQSFTISNQITASDAYSNLAGVIGMDGVDYRFTLGPIFVKNTIEIEKDVFVNITTPAEFNEQMKTSPFYLDNGDTLILGAQGSYLLAEEEGTFTNIRYDVNLIRKSDSTVHRFLFKDTVHVEDSVESVFLRGYVIDSLSAADSFYVQLVVNEDDLNDGDYTLNGVYMGEGDEEDSYGYKTMVYFEGDNPFNGNHSTLPKEYALHQNYPNPFNPSTTISYDLPKDGLIRMKVYDIAGREVMTLVNEVKTAGRYTASFNGSTLSSGVYFYRIEAGDFVQTKRMVLVK